METSNLKSKSKVCSRSSHSSTIVKNLLFDEKSADVQFIFNFDDKRELIPAHKLLLTNGSKVFGTMFDGRWKKQKEVEIVDASFDVFKEFLQFFYVDDVKITVENIPEVMNLANMYDVTECLDVCEKILLNQTSLDDICVALDAAILFDRSKLKKHCDDEIAKEPTTVFASDAFLRCSRDSLKFILKINNLNCEQVKVFEACMDWSKHACEKSKTDASMANRKQQLGDCLNLIQFALMEPQEIGKCVKNHKGLFELDELEGIVSAMADHHSGTMGKCKIFPRCPLNWNENLKLECTRSTYPNGQRYYIHKYDETAFEINKKMIFGAISTKRIVSKYGYETINYQLSGSMTISEIDYSSYTVDQVLLVQTIKFTIGRHSLEPHNYTQLNNAIMVQPNRRYHISFEFKDLVDNQFYTSCGMDSEVYYSGDHKVTFRNELLTQSNLNSCIISTLYFNAA